MKLSDRHRRLLLVEQGSHALLINLVLNGVIAWALLRGNDVVPLWGEVSMGVDLLATGVLLPGGMCEIVSRIVASQVRSGKLPALERNQVAANGMHRRSIHLRAFVLAIFGLVGVSLPLVFLLDAANRLSTRAAACAPLSLAGCWQTSWMSRSPPLPHSAHYYDIFAVSAG